MWKRKIAGNKGMESGGGKKASFPDPKRTRREVPEKREPHPHPKKSVCQSFTKEEKPASIEKRAKPRISRRGRDKDRQEKGWSRGHPGAARPEGRLLSREPNLVETRLPTRKEKAGEGRKGGGRHQKEDSPSPMEGVVVITGPTRTDRWGASGGGGGQGRSSSPEKFRATTLDKRR